METTVQWIEKADFSEFIVIQGTPGAGKSSFTLKLATELEQRGFQAIRVRLRDLAVDVDPLAEIATKVLKIDVGSLDNG